MPKVVDAPLAPQDVFAVGRNAIEPINDCLIATLNVRATGNRIGFSIPGKHYVGTSAAEEPVSARAAVEAIAVPSSGDDIVACAAEKIVAPVCAEHAIGAGEAPDEVAPLGSPQDVASRRSPDPAVVREISRSAA